MVKRNTFQLKKRNYLKTWTLHERKVHIKKKESVYEVSDKGKVDITDFWG